ncbi:MAG: hypothetical protein V3U76_18670 [Granulosicoccus sp.]
MARTASSIDHGLDTVNVSALTGQSIVGGTSSWVTPAKQGEEAVQHFAGIDKNGRMLEFRLTSDASWRVVDIGAQEPVAPVRPAASQVFSATGNTVYLAVPDKKSNLIVCLKTPGNSWQCVDVSKRTGVSLQPGCCPVIWQSGKGNQLVTHIVGTDKDSCLVEFLCVAAGCWSAKKAGAVVSPESLSAWQNEANNETTFHLAGITPDGRLVEHCRRQDGDWLEVPVCKTETVMRHRRRPTVSWTSGQTEYIAATDVIGSLVCYQRSHYPINQNWLSVNVSRETGRRVRSVSSGCTLYEKRNGESIPTLCITAESNGHAYQFWWTQRNRWQVLDATEITGVTSDRAVDFWQTNNGSSTTEHICIIDKDQIFVSSGLQRLRQLTDSFIDLRAHELKALGVIQNSTLFSRFRSLRTGVNVLSSRQCLAIDDVKDAVFGSIKQHNSAASYLDYVSGGAFTLTRGSDDGDGGKPELLIIATGESGRIAETSSSLFSLTTAQTEKAGTVVEWSTRNPLDVVKLVRQLLHCVANLQIEPYEQFICNETFGAQFDPKPDTDNHCLDIMTAVTRSNGVAFLHPSGVWKLLLGWVRPRLLMRSGRYSLKAVADSLEVIVLPRIGREREEYFLLENRQRRPFDDIDDTGIAVWHVVLNPQDLAHPHDGRDERQLQHGPAWQQHIRLVKSPISDSPLSAATTGLWKAKDVDASGGSPRQSNAASKLRWADGNASGYQLSNLSPSGDSMQFDLDIQRSVGA